jgi:hypothetical protein
VFRTKTTTKAVTHLHEILGVCGILNAETNQHRVEEVSVEGALLLLVSVELTRDVEGLNDDWDHGIDLQGRIQPSSLLVVYLGGLRKPVSHIVFLYLRRGNTDMRESAMMESTMDSG